jgi:ubiquinone/menaquinone biosynthesis C-methylase UbiE
MVQPQAGAKEYFEQLETFISECEARVARGAPYVAVLLSHELYRFLYPVEPFAGVEHTDPVSFSVEHVKKLIALGRHLDAGVSPYAFVPSADAEDASAPVEKTTSDLYSGLWRGFEQGELTDESVTLLTRRIPEAVIAERIRGKKVLDMGCGSGRYSIALAKVGAAEVHGVDFQGKAYAAAAAFCRENAVPVTFHEATVHALPFADASFDFVFCNGVLHHTTSIEKGISELSRVLRPSGASFLYLYGAGGIFWETRRLIRRLFEKIPLEYTKSVLRIIGMPQKRFIFCDTWYVPIEGHTTVAQMEGWFSQFGFSARKLRGENAFDLDNPKLDSIPGHIEMWGNGEHRYLLEKI